MEKIKSYELFNLLGNPVASPKNKQSLICFIKEDCPTCREIIPLLDSLHKTLGENIIMHVIGQEREGNQRLEDEHKPDFSILDDSALLVSYSLKIEIVPTIIAVNEDGFILEKLVGFVKDEWNELINQVSQNQSKDDINWSQLPKWRPGCGSLSVDPTNEARLKALSEDNQISARKIELGAADDTFEFMYDQGFSDGLPLIPPTQQRVVDMLSGTDRNPSEVVAVLPPNMGTVTVEKIAINSVMAGCKPDYLPVIIAAIEALADDAFNIHGVYATTLGASPLIIVSGPIRDKIGMNYKQGALGQGNRANATIGRAVRLIIRNVGGATPEGTERSTFGNPLKYTGCFAEWEERSPWEPLHVERGFKADDSVVTVCAVTGGPIVIMDEYGLQSDLVAGTIAEGVRSILNHKVYGVAQCVLVVSPEHADLFKKNTYSKTDLRRRIQEITRLRYKDLVPTDISSAGMRQEEISKLSEHTMKKFISKFADENDINIVVAGGGAGKFTACYHGWLNGKWGSVPVSKKIAHT